MSVTFNPALGKPGELAEGWPTEMRPSDGEDWPTAGHVVGSALSCPHEVERAAIKLRRVGWLDQKGRVWTVMPAAREFDGGSLAPLLINPGCD